jgi:hypothetical protein
MPGDRHAEWDQYHEARLDAKADKRAGLAPRSIPELLAMCEHSGSYIARDALIERGVFDDSHSTSINDHGHRLMRALGGKKTASP